MKIYHQGKLSIKFYQKKITNKHFCMQIIIIKIQLGIPNLDSMILIKQKIREFLICMICNQ